MLNRLLILVVLLVIPVTSLLADDLKNEKQAIRNFNFKKYLLTQDGYSDCPDIVKETCAGSTDTDYCPEGISLSVSYADLTGDGIEEAIINGSSCNAGTGGPDIHQVYALKGDNQVREITVPDVDKRYYSVLFGNGNYDLSADGGQLVAIHNDTSGRENPLVTRYKWNDDMLQIASIKAAPTYKTSYDCSRANDRHERAICYVKDLADLDLKLNSHYKRRLENLPSSGKRSLINEQARWIAERNKDCTIYKWWVECLTDKYNKRIAELE
jgi:uncharacterized protein YecT (DUF1311 family)